MATITPAAHAKYLIEFPLRIQPCPQYRPRYIARVFAAGPEFGCERRIIPGVRHHRKRASRCCGEQFTGHI
jgi:hypothetical protein